MFNGLCCGFVERGLLRGEAPRRIWAAGRRGGDQQIQAGPRVLAVTLPRSPPGRRTFPRSYFPQENLFQLVPSSRTKSFNGDSKLSTLQYDEYRPKWWDNCEKGLQVFSSSPTKARNGECVQAASVWGLHTKLGHCDRLSCWPPAKLPPCERPSLPPPSGAGCARPASARNTGAMRCRSAWPRADSGSGLSCCSSLAGLQKIACVGDSQCAHAAEASRRLGSKCVERRRSVAHIAATPAPRDGVAGALVRRDCPRCRNRGILGLFNDG